MKRIILILLICSPLITKAQSYTLNTDINGVRISDSLGNSRLFATNTLTLGISKDSSTITIKNIYLTKDASDIIIPPIRYGSIINGKTSAAFSSVTKVDSFFAAFFLK